MRLRSIAPIVLGSVAAACGGPKSSEDANLPGASARPIALAVHGGAGTLDRAEMTQAKRAGYEASLATARDQGYAILEAGGSALDAVTAVVRALEDDPQFNAGKGAVLTHDGDCELDASIMVSSLAGRSAGAGAVAGVKRTKNPILLARAVMEKSPHVMLCGAGAEAFAAECGLEMVDNEYFKTDFRREQLERVKAGSPTGRADAPVAPDRSSDRAGTVGCVALDRDGRLAAATSTGGMTNKRWGRIGDTPVIGAGTWADSNRAVSCTGWGEYFIRAAAAHSVALRSGDLAGAARAVLAEIGAAGGDGGLIAIDRDGDLALEFNSGGMYRAWVDSAGRRGVAIFADDPAARPER